MKLIKRIADYQHRQDILLVNNRDEVEQRNKEIALAIIAMGCLAFLPFIAISCFVESYKPLFFPYIIIFAMLSLYWGVCHKMKRNITSLPLTYGASTLLVAYAVYTSAFVTPNQISVIILFLIFVLPIITIDKSLRINLSVVAYITIYLSVIVNFKTAILLSDEILNCLLFATFGIVLGELLRYAQLENFELKRLALLQGGKDSLTGFYSKGTFEQMMEEILRRDINSGRTHVLLGCDIDDFKNINDRYGHAAGDLVIRELAAEMRMQFRDTDILGRIGGDEFAVLMLDCESIVILEEKLKRFCYNITKKNFGLENGDYVSISVGAAFFPQNGKTYSEIFEKVDESVYYAKAHGKSTFHILGESQETEATFRLDSRDMKTLLENATDGIAKYAYTTTLKILYFNKKLSEMATGGASMLASREFDPFSYVHPDDLAKLNDALQVALPNKTPIDVIFRIRQAGVKDIWVRLRGYFVGELYLSEYPVFYAVYTNLSALIAQDGFQEVQDEINSN